MRKTILHTLTAGTLLAACTLASAQAQKAPRVARAASAKATLAASAPLAALLAAYWDEQARLFPVGATSQGDNRYNDQLPNDQTQAFRQQRRAFYQKYQAQLRKTNRPQLNANDQTSYDSLDYDLGMSLSGLERNGWMMPFSQNGGLPSALGQLGAGTGNQPFKTE